MNAKIVVRCLINSYDDNENIYKHSYKTTRTKLKKNTPKKTNKQMQYDYDCHVLPITHI